MQAHVLASLQNGAKNHHRDSENMWCHPWKNNFWTLKIKSREIFWATLHIDVQVPLNSILIKCIMKIIIFYDKNVAKSFLYIRVMICISMVVYAFIFLEIYSIQKHKK